MGAGYLTSLTGPEEPPFLGPGGKCQVSTGGGPHVSASLLPTRSSQKRLPAAQNLGQNDGAIDPKNVIPAQHLFTTVKELDIPPTIRLK